MDDKLTHNYQFMINNDQQQQPIDGRFVIPSDKYVFEDQKPSIRLIFFLVLNFLYLSILLLKHLLVIHTLLRIHPILKLMKMLLSLILLVN